MEELQGKHKRKIKQVYDLRDIEIGTIVKFRREGQPLSYFEGKIIQINGKEKEMFFREPSFLIQYKNKNNKLGVDHVLYSNILEIVETTYKTTNEEENMEKNKEAHPRSATKFGNIIGIVRDGKLSFGKIVDESNELKVGDKGVVTLKDSHRLINNQEVNCEVVDVRTFCYVEIASLNKRAWVPADNINWFGESNEKRQSDD